MSIGMKSIRLSTLFHASVFLGCSLSGAQAQDVAVRDFSDASLTGPYQASSECIENAVRNNLGGAANVMADGRTFYGQIDAPGVTTSVTVLREDQNVQSINHMTLVEKKGAGERSVYDPLESAMLEYYGQGHAAFQILTWEGGKDRESALRRIDGDIRACADVRAAPLPRP
ncbi:MAG: hypothetical protein DI626_06020 [Micavibrio aeruginosavorus]|uniref:Uncharacterized protein n=1 Tax=Micavibrio aeruginosavorus TaxID=349221 RepID=A0A2W5BY11_9BACT|nr:MAG: hypothetical protein DI626_06020 [Micavibrio aeruginosavorus]